MCEGDLVGLPGNQRNWRRIEIVRYAEPFVPFCAGRLEKTILI